MAELSLRQAKLLRWGALQNERSSWLPRYREVSEFLLPFSGRYFTTDRNRGDKNFNSIYDSTGTRALRILAAGMMAGMTSPARPWFRLAIADRDLMEEGSVKQWLADVAQLMRDIFAKSNTYRALHSLYEELGAFNTGANIIESNFNTVIWNHNLTAGEYAIACDELGRVNTLYREFEMTVENIVGKFVYDGNRAGPADWSRVSPMVKNLWDNSRSADQWIPVLHAIEPRLLTQREYGKRDAKNMPWSSCYIEIGRGGTTQGDQVLRESGYKEFPALCPRWHTRGGDIYGNGPGMEALPDVKQLQHEQLRKGQGIDYMTEPPILLPGEAKGREVDSLPGGVNFSGIATPSARAHNLFEVSLNLEHLLADINDVRSRVNQAFYADLFIMLANQPVSGRQITAREIAERHEEKLLMLGPVLERLHDEMLAPLIDSTFNKIIEAKLLQGRLAPPPEMHGMDLNIEFVSTLAQAQRAVGLASVDRLIGTVAMLAPTKPDIMDKINTDELVDQYADMLAIDPSLIVADDKIAIIRDKRAARVQAQQMAAAAKPMSDGAKAVKTMSEVNPDGLKNVMSQFTGYTQ